MTGHNHDVLSKVTGWLGYAEDDLCLAKNTLKTMGINAHITRLPRTAERGKMPEKLSRFS